MLANDRWHKSVALLISLICVGLSIAHSITQLPAFLFWIPFFIIAKLGTIVRLETLVHRMGAFLRREGDIWESFRRGFQYDKIYLSIADILMMFPSGTALAYYYYYSESYIADAVLAVIILAGIALWVTSPANVSKHSSDSKKA
jgi:uncharacterized membrane protein YqgA involved in biofilm formation